MRLALSVFAGTDEAAQRVEDCSLRLASYFFALGAVPWHENC